MKLDGSIAAVVTGGASGLGEGTARAIAATGARVALFDLNEEAGERIAAEIGGVFCKVDVTDDASVAAAFDKARAAHGQERLTVNCAGIASGQKTVSRKKDTGEIRAHDMATFERTVRVNLFGTFRVLSQSAAGMVTLEPMADGERGLIVNTASVAAQDGQIGQAAYSASKGGVYAMTLPVARDLAQEGVRVNTILPGIMWTPMMAGMDQKIQDALAAAIPFPSRLGTPADYASLVLELARNVYINGECIRLDGAIRLAPR
ncbi:NAD(P)-dependent dehydrogenase (short-subunit alcohol dehydrogenase family) [Brevundimonas alba]|uniref:NAD(P)-dependent dehydrogenase (Short-subunit alcohol dehydrogenase family) n=1 Tax=Brevundimonas alba TaxID=74314 RepID=A0A7X5YJF2_9CAUL|nr:SDR family NAD(P)-dependent oxidoreductase [Brevundimonas alba]NJC40873.1 NAD(P)-dependent dehydrogenase (short-subunit alcohol dehydrogenase family) [Brevundimonas alba]